nr:ATP synthase subunit 6 [Myrsidea ptilorhynchi]
MTSLMSIFDPSLSLAPHTGWVAIFISILFMSNMFWQSSSTFLWGKTALTRILLSIFKSQKVIFVALFLLILNTNIAGLLPLIFSPTSHLSFNLMISLGLWFGMMTWYSWNNMGQLLSHLTPIGAPLILAPVLVLIELVSNLIRPLTLSLRLMANVMAGHMILTLISKGVASLSLVVSVPMFVVLMGFLSFEMGVALIQSYVFSSLMHLYWEESESSH